MLLASGPVIGQSAPSHEPLCNLREQSLTLRERWSYQLPDSFQVGGVAIGDDGELYVHGPHPLVLAIRPGSGVRQILLPPETDVAGIEATTRHSPFSVFDRAGKQVLVVDQSGRSLRSTPIGAQEVGEIGSVAVGRGKWAFTATSRSLDRPALFVFDRGGGLREIAALHPGGGGALGFAILVTDSLIYAFAPVFPLRPTSHAFDGLSSGAFDSLPHSLVERNPDDDSPAPLWRAVSIVPLDCGLVLTLSDVRSDSRLLVLYDYGGRVGRVRTLNTPLAFVTSSRSGRSVLAVRRAGALEIVLYDVGWGPKPD